jgi:dTDP-4-dehydrorhamnose reductase
MSVRRILITGGTGLLGKTLLETAPEAWDVLATWHQHRPPAGWQDRCFPLDVRDETAVSRLIERLRPTAVIHTASIGSVDEAQRDPQRVAAVNVDGTRAVAAACARVGSALVYISSNAVFDGTHPPYAESSPLGAVNRYGALKIEAEQRARRALASCAIIRPILMYGWPLPGGRENAVTRWVASLEQGAPVAVACDLYTQPLLAEDCADAVWAVTVHQRSGIYHVAGADRLRLFDFARHVARAFGLDEHLVTQASAEELSAFAPRPRDTSFVTDKMERELGVRPVGVEEGLRRMRQARLACSSGCPS